MLTEKSCHSDQGSTIQKKISLLIGKLVEAIRSKSARQAVQMAILRFGGLGVGALAQIYAARQLGPEKLGISGMALTVAAQGGILVTFGADALLVRQFRELKDARKEDEFISTVFTFRLLLTGAMTLALLIAVPWLLHHPQYFLASACIIPLVFFQSNQALWILQAKEMVPAQYLANTLSAFLSAILVFIFIHPRSMAGSDVVVGLVAVTLAFALSWYSACGSIPKLKFDWRAIWGVMTASKWLFLSAIVTYGYTRFEQPLVGVLRSVDELGVYRSALQVINGVQPLLVMIPLLIYPKLISWRAISINDLWLGQKRLFFQFLAPVLLLGLLAMIVIPLAYPVVFGPAFKSAAIPCVLLVCSKLVVILNGIFGWGLWAAKKDKTMLAVMSAVGISSTALYFLLIPRFGMIGAASVNLFSEIMILIACACLMHRLVTHSIKKT
jgi:O-antigen/teichoic acid export membrane protein